MIVIRDPEHILPQEEPLRQAIAKHPLHPNLGEWLDEVSVAVVERGAKIEHDRNNRAAILHLARHMPLLPEYEYILLHELTHVGDRVDPSFAYSEDDRHSLSDFAKLKMMELWNVYIDSRLHHHGKFVLGEQDKGVYCTINGKAQMAPYSIEGKLLCHISLLKSTGMPEAEKTVREIWRCPDRRLTFGELIVLAKQAVRIASATR